jgi:hypothetical protein
MIFLPPDHKKPYYSSCTKYQYNSSVLTVKKCIYNFLITDLICYKFL